MISAFYSIDEIEAAEMAAAATWNKYQSIQLEWENASWIAFASRSRLKNEMERAYSDYLTLIDLVQSMKAENMSDNAQEWTYDLNNSVEGNTGYSTILIIVVAAVSVFVVYKMFRK